MTDNLDGFYSGHVSNGYHPVGWSSWCTIQLYVAINGQVMAVNSVYLGQSYFT